jgi:hypothetical protein
VRSTFLSFFLWLVTINLSYSQSVFHEKLYTEYNTYKESFFKSRRFSHKQIQPLINQFNNTRGVATTNVGKSIEGRDISLLSIGNGPITVFLWSQMHGDESTATMAIFDILHFLTKNKSDEVATILNNLNIHFLPMLNPDGAQYFKRRNALNIDINRDALRLQSSEARILKSVRDSLEPSFGFNLHDQSKYYNATGTPHSATISFLAPAYNYEKDVNTVRANAMKVIVKMNGVLQQYIQGKVAKYDDAFEPRAFGDNIQKWGTSAILIESGGLKNDPEKQQIRKLNYVAILSALHSIATKEYEYHNLDAYYNIPDNDRKLFDLKISQLNYNLEEKNYVLDIGIKHHEVELAGKNSYYYASRIDDLGDLSTFYGYNELNASTLMFKPGKVFNKVLLNYDELVKLNINSLLKQGVCYVKMKQIPNKNHHNIPLQIVPENFKVSKRLYPGQNATFTMVNKNNQVKYAVINGFLIDVEKEATPTFKNALIID